jgi:hypothetical protein
MMGRHQPIKRQKKNIVKIKIKNKQQQQNLYLGHFH